VTCNHGKLWCDSLNHINNVHATLHNIFHPFFFIPRSNQVLISSIRMLTFCSVTLYYIFDCQFFFRPQRTPHVEQNVSWQRIAGCDITVDMVIGNILVTVQRDATQRSLFIILQVHSTCFGCQPHASSGVHKTVTTASGAATFFQRGHVGGR